ncbi:MAG: hypothetical protein ABSA32_05605 [Candidatus Acidiferrales bacterium]|jgi:hypothetical protein
MSFEEAIDILTKDDRFHATIYAMNSLLIHKGVYTREEFEALFKEWAAKETRKKTRSKQRPAARAPLQA